MQEYITLQILPSLIVPILNGNSSKQYTCTAGCAATESNNRLLGTTGGCCAKKKNPKQSQKVCQCILLEPMLWLIKSEALTSQLVLYLSFHPFIYLSVGVSTSILNNSTTPPCALPLFIPSADEVAKLFSFSCTKCLLC